MISAFVDNYRVTSCLVDENRMISFSHSIKHRVWSPFKFVRHGFLRQLFPKVRLQLLSLFGLFYCQFRASSATSTKLKNRRASTTLTPLRLQAICVPPSPSGRQTVNYRPAVRHSASYKDLCTHLI